MPLITPDQFGDVTAALAHRQGPHRIYTHGVNAASLQDLAAQFLYFLQSAAYAYIVDGEHEAVRHLRRVMIAARDDHTHFLSTFHAAFYKASCGEPLDISTEELCAKACRKHGTHTAILYDDAHDRRGSTGEFLKHLIGHISGNSMLDDNQYDKLLTFWDYPRRSIDWPFVFRMVRPMILGNTNSAKIIEFPKTVDQVTPQPP